VIKVEFGYKEVFVFIACLAIIAGTCVLLFFVLVTENSIVLGEGTVIDFQIQARYGGNIYMVLLDDGKWYEILKTEYLRIQIGDYVQIFKSGRVLIL